MAATFDAVSNSGANGTAQNPSYTHTPSGTPTGAGIIVAWVDTGGKTLSSVTYGGAACTLEASTSTVTFWSIAAYSIANPASGGQTVQANFSGTLSHDSVIITETVTGGNTTNAISSANVVAHTGTGIDFTVTGTITSSANECCMDGVAFQGSLPSLSPGAGQTSQASVAMTPGGAASSRKAGSASVTMSWAEGSQIAWAQIVMGFKDAGGGGGATVSSQMVKQIYVMP